MSSTKAEIDHNLRGFAYFDTFDDLEKWDKNAVDVLQKANTPLLKRASIVPSKEALKSNVLVMRDFRGGYLQSGYEASQGATVPHEDYVMEQWQRVEVFNYFNHYRVSIPPPSWVNAGHRNGSLVLGTFCIEGDPAEKSELQPHRIIEKSGDRFWLADVLSQMAVTYGFDGWLINIETDQIDVSDEVWSNGLPLAGFLKQLRGGLKSLPSGGKVIWYVLPKVSEE